MDVQITELVKFEVDRIDGVESPANGFPVLMMKGLGVAKGMRDCPKCGKNYDADHQGGKCENCGTDLPDAPAAKGDGDGDADDAAKALAAEYEDRLAWVAKGGRNYSAGERKQMAGDGRALPDGSYPINDEHDLNSAAILARSGHGNVAAAKKHIGKRAKELGVPNPLADSPDDASKSQIAPEGTTVDTVTQTGELSELVKAAIAEATTPLQKRIEALDAELAKVKATPVPTSIVPSRNVQVKAPGGIVNTDYAAKAAYYRQMADTINDRETAEGYRKLAREADAKAVTPTS